MNHFSPSLSYKSLYLVDWLVGSGNWFNDILDKIKSQEGNLRKNHNILFYKVNVKKF